MTGFAAQMKQEAVALDKWAHAVHERVADIAFDSIVNGSSLTGAPGQPIAAPMFEHAGALRDSWKKARTAPDVITLSTDMKFAPIVEDNLKGVRFRANGPHSVKLTVLAQDRIVALAMQQGPKR